ncbi:hypothetical protein [Gloeocapsopsis dulcis]|uniref:CYTH domain-containing protein n=1 Tax=Gloeocapsopsis dulcis AAB1 = 1H9 TaxID=1433147 RepID=A0A6N8FSQ6_9CHRO|nr:hypothetical protein [Gloeocapsopsis dulcis]MUL35602.1 hypothetical protein [Gloeocapsopsis dulcis AAB1 = 1H9]WNN87496.1 hypothetical protein P0S91_14290 [Gloeocapsopsis dulcis]
MLTTAEMRWFNPGKLPEGVLQWFEQDQLGYLAPAEEREDIYLYVPESEFVGIKLRQGRLEIKWRKAELGDLQFGKVTGKTEKWAKWLCEDASNESFQPQDVMGKKAWVSLKKMRTQRKYRISPEQTIVAISVNDSSDCAECSAGGDRTCSVEITQLEINSNPWWSLAFEASIIDESPLANLKCVAEWIFENYPGELQIENSYAYPTWLDIVV